MVSEAYGQSLFSWYQSSRMKRAQGAMNLVGWRKEDEVVKDMDAGGPVCNEDVGNTIVAGDCREWNLVASL